MNKYRISSNFKTQRKTYSFVFSSFLFVSFITESLLKKLGTNKIQKAQTQEKHKLKKTTTKSADSSQRTYTGDLSNETVFHYGPDLHFLMTSEAEQLFICVLFSYIPPENFLYQLFVHFLIGPFIVLVQW